MQNESRDPFGGKVCYVKMQITFLTRKFRNGERNLYCDVVHITTKWVSSLTLDCNGVFAIKAYWIAIGGFTVTSYAVSRGHPAPLVGKKDVWLAGSACIFAWIHALFTLILLTHKIMIMVCICVGVPLALCGRLVLVCYHPKKWKTKKTLVECVQL